MGQLLWWMLFPVLWTPILTASYDDEKCLDIPEVTPKKYFHLTTQNSKSLTIYLETSSRITHQLSTNVFYIFAKEVLGYSKLEITLHEDDFQIEDVIRRLSEYSDLKVSEPPATINLEVWVSPDYDTYATEYIKECGALAPPGRFGWFIPKELNTPIQSYYRNRQVSLHEIQELHWSFFLDRNLVRIFHVEEDVLESVVEAKQYNRHVDGTRDYICNNATICSKSMYTPGQCVHQYCATLLAPHFNATRFVIDQIEEANLFVRILWLGDNLKNAIEDLKRAYRGTQKSLLIFNWSPSDIVLHEQDFFSVTFKNNELYNFTHLPDVGYRYEMHRLVKLAWSKVEKAAKPLHHGIRSFKFEKDEYNHLLNLYESNYPKKTIREIACEWMKLNQKTWETWKKKTESVIYIGGIFPMSLSAYNGAGIARGAVLAQNAINRNKTLLPDYSLKLLATDGKCVADNVMKNFIDFIVEGYYDNLVGVLGPACSETVEPLAGVSKHYHIMVISYSAEGASFSNRKKYPYFFRTIGENKHYKHVYMKLFKYFGWKRVAALTEDGQKYTEYISFMQDDLEKNQIHLIANKKFPRERETDAMTRYLEDLKSKRARIIIADVVDDVARTVMCEAYRLKMTAAEGYVWFLPMWLNATWYNTDYFNERKREGVNCTTEEMIKGITGYFSMTHAYYAQDDDIMQENMTVGAWRAKYARMSLSDYAGFAYDAVWTYAFALDKLARTDPEAMSNLHSENTTDKLVQLVEATDFNGLSGRIKFRGGPSRFSTINVIQWYDNSMHTIGHFYPNLTDDKPEILGGNLKLNMSAIRWFTPDKKVPEDGTLPPTICVVQGVADVFGVECQTAIIILNIMGIGFLGLLVSIFVLVMKRRYEKKVEKTANYIKALGIPFDMNNTSELDKWEIAKECVVINRKLGEGAFGTVYGGEANLPNSGWCAVAVKTLKVGSSTEEKLDFLSEAEVMKRFDHQNIIKLVGVCTKDEPVYTIMEFMLYGDLKTYLLARRHLVKANKDENDEVSAKRLTSMAYDVAKGLSYLAELKYVHRDVASRNCLVNAQRCVKLGDFGMTRAMFDNDYYKFTRKGMLPVRWMSPESLELGVFKPSSDVWSFGVLLYEIVTFGSFPFQGKSNAQVLDYVKAGHCLDIPRGTKPQLEGLIKSCFNRDSSARPHASEIVEFLANNPRLLTPCLETPTPAMHLDDTDQLDLTIPDNNRRVSSPSTKTSPTKISPAKAANPSLPFNNIFQDRPDADNIPLEEHNCPREPLLGPSRSSSNLLRYVPLPSRRDNDEDDYVTQSPPERGGGNENTNV